MKCFLASVKYSKGQMKMQQMAFMLVALMVFFGMVALIYISLSSNRTGRAAEDLEERDAKEVLRKFVGVPEIGFTSGSDCSSCVDFDKILMLKDLQSYNNFWNFDYLMVERIYPSGIEKECTPDNYPDCSKITLISAEREIETQTVFVSVVRWDEGRESFVYEIGRIHASAKK